MSTVMRLLALGALVLFAAGCGGDGRTSGGSGRLHVQQLVADGSPIPIEGAYHYVRVAGDSSPVERRLSDERTPQATFALRAGHYKLESWQRTCDGNCGTLDPPSDSCSSEFDLDPEQRLGATITVTYGSGCRIEFR